MSRSIIKLGFFTAIALVLSVIWPNPAVFGEIPTLIPLGQIREGLSVPMRVDLDAVGFVFVADTRGRIVKVYNPQGEFVYQINDPFSATGKFPSIFALAVNSASGEV